MSVYAVSDLHGQYKTFIQGLKAIKLTRDDHLYVLGDAIDRGPDGIKILQTVMDSENMDLILGNHEFMMLNSVDPEGKGTCNGKDTDLWQYYNGGHATFTQWIKDYSLSERRTLLSWLNSRKLIKTIHVDTASGEKNFTLCHSYYDPEYEDIPYNKIPYEKVWDIVWRSMFRNDSNTRCKDVYKDHSDRTFITGHVPVQRIRYFETGSTAPPEIYRHGNLINIDGGLSFADKDAGSAAIFFRLDNSTEYTVPFSG